ncbi:MAG: cyclopropane-fatty-acyl-phospholipid synthase family protein [Burkholderiales bacterium]
MRTLIASFLATIALAALADENDWRVPFIATPDEVVVRMLELAGAGPEDLVVDLGSGDGRIVITAAERFGSRGLGIELDRGLVETSRQNARRAGVAARVRFVQGDVLSADFSKASIVTVYLLPQLIGELQPRFLKTLKPGTRIVSHAFRMAGWRPDRTETLRLKGPHPGQGEESTLYLWIVPAEVRGTWSAENLRLRIDQNYQEIEVEGATGATLRGAEIAWQSPRGSFHGRVEGARIVGELQAGAHSVPLTLRRSR